MNRSPFGSPSRALAALAALAGAIAAGPAVGADDPSAKPVPALSVGDAGPAFARMLAHTPSRQMPPVPAGLGSDPLMSSVAWTTHDTRAGALARRAPVLLTASSAPRH